jgi:3-hydroxyisobutyrate dehydrogenase-like beta-hydroxyacid dehydrogenase
VLPVDLQVTFAGGEQARYFVPAEAFAKGDEVFFTIPDGREVTQVIADPDGHTPDQNRDDNSWAEMTMTPGPMPESPNR